MTQAPPLTMIFHGKTGAHQEGQTFNDVSHGGGK
jgi:hypothetical protein